MLFWRWVSSFNLSPLFSYNHSSFHVTERREFFSFEHYIYPCSIKKLQAISLTSWQRTNSAHMNCALYTYSVCRECSWCLVKCSWKRRWRRRRIRPAASHYLLHSAAQPSHLNCIQPTGFPQHTAHNVPFYVSFSKLSPPRIGANGEKVALESTGPIFLPAVEVLQGILFETETLPATNNDWLATWSVSHVGILDLDRSINCLWWILLASVQVLDVTSLRCRSLDLSASPCIKYLLPQWQHV